MKTTERHYLITIVEIQDERRIAMKVERTSINYMTGNVGNRQPYIELRSVSLQAAGQVLAQMLEDNSIPL